MDNKFQSLVQSSTMSYFQTGNPLVDGFLLCIVSYIFTKIFENIGEYNINIKNIFKKKYKYSVGLLSYENSSTKNPVFRSSNSFNEVTLYLKEKSNITSITENFDSFKGSFSQLYTDMWTDKEKIQLKSGITITEKDVFLIEDGIYGEFQKKSYSGKEDSDRSSEIYLVLMSNKSLNHINSFIKKCNEYFHKRTEEVISRDGPYIWTYLGKNEDVLTFSQKYFRSEQTFENSYFDNKKILADAVRKFKNDEYYKKHPCITRKLVPLFYGEPGTGKTFGIRLLAKELKRNIVILPLNKVKTPEELEEILYCERIKDSKVNPSKLMFVIEDLDAMSDLLQKRTSDTNKKTNSEMSELVSLLKKDKDDKNGPILHSDSSLTMSDVLNILDGVYKLDNFVIAFSTNHIEHLDKAFLRDQRITHKIEFTFCSKKIIKKIVEDWYDVFLSDDKLKDVLDKKWSLANVVTLCDRNNSYEDVLQKLK